MSPQPPPDPLGYPAPLAIMFALAYLTLTLHFLAMNYTVGSGALLLWAKVRGKDEQQGIAKFLGSGMPLGVSYLVTLGIPPLLFVQVLYGQQFYSSSVVMGSLWILVIPVILKIMQGA